MENDWNDVITPEQKVYDIFGTEEIVEPEQIEVPKDVESFLDSIYGEEEEVGESEEEEEKQPVEDNSEKKVEKKKVAEKKEDDVNSDLLKAGAEYLAAKFGIELPEVEKWDGENFPLFLEELAEFKAEEKYNGFKSSNEIAEAILNVLENGGNKDQLISLFKEQREFNSIDTSTAKGKIEKIKTYYRDIDGKDDAWINKRIIAPLSVSEDESEIDAELLEVEKKYDDHVATHKAEQVQAAKIQKEQRIKYLETQKTNFSKTLELEKIAKKEIPEWIDYVFNDNKWQLKSGAKISTFDKDILEAKRDPEKLLKVSLLLRDEKLYNEKIITEAKNKKVEAVFNKSFKKTPEPKATAETGKPKTFFNF